MIVKCYDRDRIQMQVRLKSKVQHNVAYTWVWHKNLNKLWNLVGFITSYVHMIGHSARRSSIYEIWLAYSFSLQNQMLLIHLWRSDMTCAEFFPIFWCQNLIFVKMSLMTFWNRPFLHIWQNRFSAVLKLWHNDS